MCLCNNYTRTCGGGGLFGSGDPLFLKSDSLYGRPSLSAPSPKSTPRSISAHALGADWHVGEVH